MPSDLRWVEWYLLTDLEEMAKPRYKPTTYDAQSMPLWDKPEGHPSPSEERMKWVTNLHWLRALEIILTNKLRPFG